MDIVMRSVKLKFLIFGTMTFVLMVIYSCVNQTFLESNGNGLVGIVEMVRTDKTDNSNNHISFSYLNNHSNIDLKGVTGYSELIGDISNNFGNSERDIKITLIDKNYTSIYKKIMVSGAFPDSQDFEEGQPYIVISDSLSTKLFKSIDTIGNHVNLLNQKFKVIGVYKSNDSLPWSLFGDGFDRVLIPYKSFEDGTEIPVDILSVKKEQEQTLYDVENTLKSEFSDKLSAYNLIDYTNANHILNRYNNLVIFLLGVFVIIYTLAFTRIYLILQIRRIKTQCKKYYLAGILRAEKKRIILCFITTFICISVIMYMIRLIKFNFYIPDSYIPYDNIFDLKFYFEQLSSDIKAKNMLSDSILYSRLEYVYRNVRSFNLLCSLFTMLFLIVSTSFFKLMKVGGIKFTNTLICVFLIMASGSLVGLVLSFALGLKITVSLKTFIVVSCFYIISGLASKIKELLSQETYNP